MTIFFFRESVGSFCHIPRATNCGYHVNVYRWSRWVSSFITAELLLGVNAFAIVKAMKKR